ncbi:MAG: histidine triad nucleotide-binding protein [Candidatus Omnitrophica bacterium]|nr:histidine triad nucleotide-binding protein [Candidatus Omnitrophota bacterium]
MGEQNCLFCKIIAGEIPSNKVYEDDSVFAFYDITPQAPEHILIIPKKHISGVDQIEAEDSETISAVMYAAKKIAQEKKVRDGSYRIVFNNGPLAGQAVLHLHAHLLAGRPMKWPPG